MRKKALSQLIQMSKYAGGRFDLVQAGGGNTSIKYGSDKMLIKASGYLLSELSENKGYVAVELQKVLDIMQDADISKIEDKKQRDKKASERLNKSIFEGDERPSIETYLHALLYKYTFHIHPVAVNVFTTHKNWDHYMRKLDSSGLCISYKTPGIELALELKKGLEKYKEKHHVLPKIVYLQNHGLIISSDKFSEIEILTEKIIKKAEYMAGLDFAHYRQTTLISKVYNEAFSLKHIAYLSENRVIYKLIRKIKMDYLSRPFSPDGFVFCGHTVHEVKSLSVAQFRLYLEKYSEPPKIIRYRNELFIMAADLKKAKMIEDVFKNNLLLIENLESNISCLNDDELLYLGNWDAEKYRQEMP